MIAVVVTLLLVAASSVPAWAESRAASAKGNAKQPATPAASTTKTWQHGLSTTPEAAPSSNGTAQASTLNKKSSKSAGSKKSSDSKWQVGLSTPETPQEAQAAAGGQSKTKTKSTRPQGLSEPESSPQSKAAKPTKGSPSSGAWSHGLSKPDQDNKEKKPAMPRSTPAPAAARPSTTAPQMKPKAAAPERTQRPVLKAVERENANRPAEAKVSGRSASSSGTAPQKSSPTHPQPQGQ